MSRELIRVEGVDRAFGPVTVLEDINLVVNDGDRIGIVGHNGSGKTTLLNTISEQKQDVGDIEFASGIRIAYLTQIRDIEEDSTIEEELGRRGRQFQELEEEIFDIKPTLQELWRVQLKISLNISSFTLFIIYKFSIYFSIFYKPHFHFIRFALFAF